MGLFSVLSVANTGLSASRIGMDVTGQNIANADVEGYSRKRLNLSAAYRRDDAFGQMGFGVEVINIERVRNKYIDEQIRRQNREVGYYEEVDHALERVENIFLEPSDEGLQHFMNEFYDSWDVLANDPEDLSARTMVKTNAEILVDVFHNLSGELRDVRQSRNDEIEQRVNRVNELSQEIYNLNLEISSVEINDQNANDSRDRRDLLLKELGKLIDIDVIENERGQVTVTTMGNIIVSPVDTQKLELTFNSYQLADGTRVNDLGIRFANSKRQYIPNGGQIRGLMDSRDILIPQSEEQLDAIAKALVEKVNEIHTDGYNLMGYSGQNFFDPEVTGASDIAIAPTIISDVQNIAAAGGGAKRQAVPPDTITHAYGDPPVPLSHRNVSVDTAVVTNTVTNSVLRNGIDYRIDPITGNFQLLNSNNDNMALSVDYQYTTGGFNGPGDNTTAISISALRHTNTMSEDSLGNPTATFEQYYGAFIGRLGLNRNEAASNLETREFLVEQFQSQQDSIAGVSLDEEMANLIKFQHTYQAAARLISTADQMLDVLMNM
jgi:flagellar hook-associated protein 1 FlgK